MSAGVKPPAPPPPPSPSFPNPTTQNNNINNNSVNNNLRNSNSNLAVNGGMMIHNHQQQFQLQQIIQRSPSIVSSPLGGYKPPPPLNKRPPS